MHAGKTAFYNQSATVMTSSRKSKHSPVFSQVF